MQTDGEEDDDSDDEVDKGCGDDCDSCDDGSDDERQRGRVCTKTEPKVGPLVSSAEPRTRSAKGSLNFARARLKFTSPRPAVCGAVLAEDPDGPEYCRPESFEFHTGPGEIQTESVCW